MVKHAILFNSIKLLADCNKSFPSDWHGVRTLYHSTGSRGARFEQTSRFSRVIDRDRQPTWSTDICCVTRVTHHMYRRTNNCGLLNPTRSIYFVPRSESFAWDERIVERMKQDRISRHKVTYVKRLYLRSNEIDLYGKNGPTLQSNLTPLRPVIIQLYNVVLLYLQLLIKSVIIQMKAAALTSRIKHRYNAGA